MSRSGGSSLLDAVAILQRFVCAVEEGRDPNPALAASLPAPSCEADRLAIESMLLKVACRLGSRAEFARLSARYGTIGAIDVLARRRARQKSGHLRLSTTEHDVPLRDVAAREGFSTQTLRRRITKVTGRTPRDVAKRERIAHALELLSTGMKVIAVARECGYRSERSFFAAFRALTGLTPAATRRASRDELAALRRIILPWLDHTKRSRD